MTITYTMHVATATGLPSCFVKLLKRWRGSIYKLIYCDLLVFLGIYYAIKLVYFFLLNSAQKETFGHVVGYFSMYTTKIPITFVLGFYVSIVVQRWCQQVFQMPWPDPTAIYVSSQIRGNDEHGRKMRRTVMRYINLSYVMVFRLISPKVKNRFPTYGHLVDAGILVENEKKIIQKIDEIYPNMPKYWMPIVWASSIFTRARKEGRIRDDFALRSLNDAINQFRHNCILMLHYDTISVPLVYSQVVTLAVYSYFCASLIGNQWVEEGQKREYTYSLDYYFPFFTTLEFFFFMGWLKVAEVLICPWGNDDDDFEVNAMVDRNIQVSYIIVDEMHNRHPQLMKDQYWDEVYPVELPGEKSDPPIHSTAHMDQKLTSGRGSLTDYGLEESPSKTQFIWKRLRNDDQGVTLQLDRRSSDSDRTLNEQFYNKHVHSLHSHPTSDATIQPNYGEEEIAEEEEEDEGNTFERLRQARRSERIERQQLKVQRTVENVSDLTADIPIRIRKAPSTERLTEGSDEEPKKKPKNDEQNKADKDKDDTSKEEDEQDQDKK